MVTFGSSGIVNQVMSGFMITYSRALRVGDFVRIGDVEGTVTQLGILSTKIRTLRQRGGDDSERRRRRPDDDRLLAARRPGRRLHADVGDDRLRHAVAAGARAAAAGGRADRRACAREPKPVVLQASLEDFYVEVHAVRVPRTAAVAARSRWTRCTRTSRICSTSTACRSCRRTTCWIRRRRKSWRAPNWFAAPAQPDPPPPVSTAQPPVTEPHAHRW